MPLINGSIIGIETFNEIPSSRSVDLPFIGHGLELLKKPAGPEQMWKNVIAMKNKYAPNSPMMRAHMPLVNSYDKDGMVLWLFDPELFKVLYQNEGKYPFRGPKLEFIRLIRNRIPDVYKDNLGLFFEEGEKWRALRSSVQQDMMRPQSAHFYIDQLNKVGKDFSDHIRNTRNEDGIIEDFTLESYKFSFEAISVVALDERIGAFPVDNIVSKDSERLLQALHSFNQCSINLVFGFPFWRIYPNPRWDSNFKKVENVHEEILGFIKKRVNNARNRLERNGSEIKSREISMLQKFIKSNGPHSIIPMVLSFDLMIGGIDTTGNTLANMTYLLARNPDKQEKIREEINSVIKKGLPITSQILAKIKILRATVKETLRMYPVGGMTTRVLPEDAIIGGYIVPKGTFVAISLHYNKGLFRDPDEFKPERWLRENSKEINPFTSLAFSQGVRSCIGRRFAELELELALLELMHNFRIEWAGDKNAKLEGIQQMSVVPNMPVKLRFLDL